MARKITVTRAELAALRWFGAGLGYVPPVLTWDGDGRGHAKALVTLLGKAEAAHAPVPESEKGTPVAAAESAFLVAAGKSGAAMGRLSTRDAVALTRDLKERGCTPEQLAVVGRWLAGQRWFRGHATLRQVLNNWATWYGRAKVEAPGRHAGAPAPLSAGSSALGGVIDVTPEDFTDVNRGGGVR